MSLQRRKGQGAFEYILLLGGILLVIVILIILMRSYLLSPTAANVEQTGGRYSQVTNFYFKPAAMAKEGRVSLDVGMADAAVALIPSSYAMLARNSSDNSVACYLSSDGVSWTLQGTAAVLANTYPVTLLFENGEYKLWYGYDAPPNVKGGFANSTDCVTWTAYAGNPVFQGNPAGWDRFITGLSIVKAENGYRAFYSATSAGNSAIGLATSSDGLSFTRFQGTGGPVLDAGDEGGIFWSNSVYLPAAYFGNNVYWMYYKCSDAGRKSVCQAFSRDGISWEQRRVVLELGSAGAFDDTDFTMLSLVMADGKFKLWYGAMNSTDDKAEGLASAKAVPATTPT